MGTEDGPTAWKGLLLRPTCYLLFPVIIEQISLVYNVQTGLGHRDQTSCMSIHRRSPYGLQLFDTCDLMLSRGPG